jgi:GT2 family glycosyltransferase
MTARSLVIVNYFSAAHTARAIASAREASSEPLEVIVVDNSCDVAEADRLRSCGADNVLHSRENRGYGGGLNDGVAASRGEILILSNPDVVFGHRAIDLLSDALTEGVAMAGPRFSWDDAGRFLLPPPERPRPWRKRMEIAGLTSRELTLLLGFLRFRARLRFWETTQSEAVDSLSGAVMAMRRATFATLGGFDERFRLYFEEIDLMERALRGGLTLQFVPSAACRHLYNQSASGEPAAGERYLESEVLYFEKWYGETIIESMRNAPPQPAAMPDALPRVSSLPGPAEDEEVILELSPLRDFSSASGCIGAAEACEIPPEIIASLNGGPLFARLVRRSDSRVEWAVEIVSGG